MIEMIPLDRLVLSPLNPRKTRSQSHIDALAESIRTIGLQQNLIGYMNPLTDGVEIVGGGTRLLALQSLHRSEISPKIPVQVYEDGDFALQAAIAENEAREGMHPIDAAVAYREQLDAGIAEHVVAQMFGKPVAEVRKIAALTLVIPEVLEAYRAEQIGLDLARAFHIGTPEQQRAFWNANKDRLAHIYPTTVRAAMKQGIETANRSLAFRFVGEDAYLAAGGKLTRDLFGESVYIDSPDILDTLVNAKLRAAAELVRDAEGWDWCDIEMPEGPYRFAEGTPVELTEEEQTELDALSDEWGDWEGFAESLDEEKRKSYDRFVALISKTEQVTFSEDVRAAAGVVAILSTEYDADTRQNVPVISIERGIVLGQHEDKLPEEPVAATPDAPKPDYPQSLLRDMDGLQTAILQAVVAKNPEVALTLLAWAISTTNRFVSPPLFPSLPGEGTVHGPAVVSEGEADGPLGFSLIEKPEGGVSLADLTADKKRRNRVLALGIAKALSADRITTIRSAMLFLDVDQRAYWTPGPAFFKRLTTGVCKKIFYEVTGVPFDTACGTKMKSAEVKDTLVKLFANPAGFVKGFHVPQHEDGRPVFNWSLTLVGNVGTWLPEPMRLVAIPTPAAEDEDDEIEIAAE